MKVKIVVERSDGRYVEIPITKREAYNLCELMYMLGHDTWDTLKLNKISIKSIYDKIEFLEHDVLNEGKMYGFNKEDGKLIPLKQPHFLVKRPKWKKR